MPIGAAKLNLDDGVSHLKLEAFVKLFQSAAILAGLRRRLPRMKPLALALTLVIAAPGFAQVQVTLDLPRIVFPAPPPLVVISPGVQVVEDNDDEVFFVDNWYWHKRGGRWYRNQTHNGTWVVVEERIVPRPIFGYAPGSYRKWHGHKKDNGTVVINPPGPGKIKVKGGKGNKHD